MSDTYPRARYLHLTRHPVPSVASMHRAWEDKGYWNVRPELFHHFCLAVWYHQHTRIVEFASSLPPDRVLRVRSEDVLNAPAETLPAICRWLGLEAGEPEIEAMTHPERSPYARTGPPGRGRRLGSGLHARAVASPHRAARLARPAGGAGTSIPGSRWRAASSRAVSGTAA